ncbi:sulfur carrier protein ThiS [Marinoscillum furvescens]|uniref:Sulfur carrier protein ThiS n=1 Tax=Marinoscillum furvescens DSM 4134 TaxID=1122208 RepID=A0A3D9L6J2_MARFU|nr:sulfur carrier protein ThiS [Marinoscillum furvescens]REE01777.1 sulfur carrier protein ThiS [Marinoscillum furvescens DSM 4134]
MDFTINNEKLTVNEAQLTLLGALALKGIHQTKGIAVAVNQQIVPRTLWEEQSIQPNDQILIITATQGG